MPKVPTYDAPQVDTKPLPGPYQSSVASPELFGETGRNLKAAGQGMVAAGTAFSDLLWKKQQDDDKALVMSRRAILQDTMMEGLVNAKQKKVGEMAMGYGTEFLESFDKAVEAVVETLPNDNQKKLFKESIGSLRATGHHEALVHEAAETTKFRGEALMGVLNGTAKIGAELTFLPDVKAQLDLGKKALAEHLMSKGISPQSTDGKPVFDAKMLEYTNLFHTSRVKALMSKNELAAANEYFQMAVEAGEINPTAATSLRNSLNDMLGRQASTSYVDKLFAQSPNEPESHYAQAIIETVKDAERRSQAMAAMKTHLALRDQKKKEDLDAATKPFDTALGQAIQKHRFLDLNSKEMSAMLNTLNNASPEEFQKSVATASAWNDHLRSLQKAAAGGAAGKSAADKKEQEYSRAFSGLLREAQENPIGWRNRSLESLQRDPRWWVLKETDRQELQRMQKPGESPSSGIMFKMIELQKGFFKNEFGNDSMEKMDEFTKWVWDRVNATETRTKKPMTHDEIKHVIDSALLEGEVKTGSMFRVDPNVRAFEAPPGSNFVPDKPLRANALTDVPKADQDKIKAEAAKRKIIITPQEIIRKYNQLHGYK